jgi:glucosamine--fructose-6-phosphate aminotransferase (isomerizing)
MCGIVGYIGDQEASGIILNGLKKLEYRGYDSAGLAVINQGVIELRRDAGKLNHLQELVKNSPVTGTVGIGHTRWATHGVPNARNAHPHVGSTGQVVIVHNGIVENYQELKDELIAEGVEFKTETDTETIVHLIERFYDSQTPIETATRKMLRLLKGAHGIVVLSAREPGKIIAARIGNAGGVVIGFGKNEMFVASDIPAILEHTREVAFLDSMQMAVVTQQGAEISTIDGKTVKFERHILPFDPVSAEKGEYRHFMQKEIHEFG